MQPSETICRRPLHTHPAPWPRRCLLAASMAIVLGTTPSSPVSADEVAAAKAKASMRQPDIAGALTDPRLKSTHLMAADELAAFVDNYRMEAFLPRTSRVTRIVSNCNDSGIGSLRAAMTSAVTGDLVDASELTCSTITLLSGQITVSADELVFTGPGQDRLTVRNGAGDGLANRLFHHTGTGIFAIGAVTLADGRVIGAGTSPSAAGGCVLSSGTVSLGNPLAAGNNKYNATVRNCRAIADRELAAGGGIAAKRVLLTNSRVIDNEASGEVTGLQFSGGGGVFGEHGVFITGSELSGNRETGTKYGGGAAAIGPNSGDGDNLVIGSTITGNHADVGGGLTVFGRTRVVNSTISGNQSLRHGAGILVAGAIHATRLELFGSTVTGNAVAGSDHGGGVFAVSGTTLDLRSSIIAGNSRGNHVANDLGGESALSGSHNLIGASFATQPLPVDTVINTDPRLWPLAYNGGRTRTHALRADSQAINLGINPHAVSTDQRGTGFPRAIGVQPDIGAFEFNPAQADWIFVNGFE